MALGAKWAEIVRSVLCLGLHQGIIASNLVPADSKQLYQAASRRDAHSLNQHLTLFSGSFARHLDDQAARDVEADFRNLGQLKPGRPHLQNAGNDGLRHLLAQPSGGMVTFKHSGRGLELEKLRIIDRWLYGTSSKRCAGTKGTNNLRRAEFYIYDLEPARW